ncbi:MAG: hypothetical protein ACRD1Q_09065 [Vicinamibacterales bacterium]
MKIRRPLSYGGATLAHQELASAVITTNHQCFDYQAIAERIPLVVDTRNALRGIQSARVFRL